MGTSLEQLTLVIDAGRDTDLEELAALTEQLRQELLDLDVEDVEIPRTTVAADGSKSDMFSFEWGTLLVSLGSTYKVLPAVVGVVQGFVTRLRGHAVDIEFDGDKFEMTGLSPDQAQQFIDQWFARHPPSEGRSP